VPPTISALNYGDEAPEPCACANAQMLASGQAQDSTWVSITVRIRGSSLALSGSPRRQAGSTIFISRFDRFYDSCHSEVARFRRTAHSRGGETETKSPASKPLVFTVFETLRPYLSQVVGNLGFSAVFSRALAITSADFEWLRAVRVKPDGSLEGLGESEAKAGPKEMAECRVVLLAEFVSLLVGLIGERLVLQLLHEAMPNVSKDDLYF
jgi:hypothetical protein